MIVIGASILQKFKVEALRFSFVIPAASQIPAAFAGRNRNMNGQNVLPPI
jgi:hypothetical protein